MRKKNVTRNSVRKYNDVTFPSCLNICACFGICYAKIMVQTLNYDKKFFIFLTDTSHTSKGTVSKTTSWPEAERQIKNGTGICSRMAMSLVSVGGPEARPLGLIFVNKINQEAGSGNEPA